MRRIFKAAAKGAPEELSPLELGDPRPGGHEHRILGHFGIEGCEITTRDPVLGRGCIMLFTNRSGSNFLADLLQATGRLSRFNEDLNGGTVVTRSRKHQIRSFHDYMLFLDKLKRKSGKSRADALLGIKASADQAIMLARFGIIANMFASVDWIFIRRRDLAAQAVSLNIAQQTRAWTSRQESNGATVRYDFEGIARAMQFISVANTRIEQAIAIFDCPVQTVYYEDLVEDPDGVVSGLLAGLGFKGPNPIARDARLAKQGGPQNAEFRARFLKDLQERVLRP